MAAGASGHADTVAGQRVDRRRWPHLETGIRQPGRPAGGRGSARGAAGRTPAGATAGHAPAAAAGPGAGTEVAPRPAWMRLRVTPPPRMAWLYC
ncbi:hypothetical protein G6F40_014567 [Rhizopus arrhizus]|nr:hypothetical protein G6F40_014567 [Rhizopus arrhizus]